MKKKILVTGAAGFIGGNLCKRLIDEDYQVIGLDDLSSGTMDNLPPGVDFHLADIREKTIYPFFKEAEAVFHLAAKNCLIDCLNDPYETSDINVTGTVNVLEAAKQAKVGKFVYANSSAVYEGVRQFPSQTVNVKPLGAYAISKHAGGLFAQMYRRFFGLNITSLRYFNVYGPAQDYKRVIPPVISGFILKILSGESPIIYGTGAKRRDFIHVDDVNDFHLLTLRDRRTDGRVFNLGSGSNYSVLEILDLVLGVFGLKSELKPSFHQELPGEAEITLADISQELELGWRPKKDIVGGIRESVEYLRKALKADGERMKLEQKGA